MKLTRLARNWVFPGAPLACALASSCLCAQLLFGSDPGRTKPGSHLAPLWSVLSPKADVSGDSPLPRLTARFEVIRKLEKPEAARERYALIHEIGRVGTPESKRFLIELAEAPAPTPAAEVDRLAVVSALSRQRDTASIQQLADRTHDPLIVAKAKALASQTN